MMHGQRGASMVETAITLALLLTIAFGIMEYGRVLYTYHAVSNAARLGTRYAIVRGSQCTASGCPATNATVSTYVKSQTQLVDPAQLTVTTTWPASNCKAPGCPVKVTVSYAYSIVSPLLPAASFTMTSSSQMLISQ